MFALLLISIFVLALASIVYLRLKKLRTADDPVYSLPPPPHAGLFTDTSQPRAEVERATRYGPRVEALAADLLARARQGDTNVLMFAHEAGEAKLYDDLLSALVERARTSPEELRALAAYVTRHARLRGSAALAEAVLDDWARSPEQVSARHALHVAALSGDADVYARAVGSALRHWREGKLSNLAPEKLSAQLESEYWVLDARARASGAGFVLKQTLAGARRELLEASRRATE